MGRRSSRRGQFALAERPEFEFSAELKWLRRPETRRGAVHAPRRVPDQNVVKLRVSQGILFPHALPVTSGGR